MSDAGAAGGGRTTRLAVRLATTGLACVLALAGCDSGDGGGGSAEAGATGSTSTHPATGTPPTSTATASSTATATSTTTADASDPATATSAGTAPGSLAAICPAIRELVSAAEDGEDITGDVVDLNGPLDTLALTDNPDAEAVVALLEDFGNVLVDQGSHTDSGAVATLSADADRYCH